ncbi:MAG: CRISPR-associated endonuclease Cas2 [Desulfobulbaceae bacterium]|jgi:CRISPR-associated protein Cas2|nr:CRISPR-associated endonuclease Cas2 [Desulfobulbaceae bacterium]
MSNPGKYVIIYDISDDKERNRLAKLLEGFGFRVQESAFECLLTRPGRERLLAEIAAQELETGFVNIYRINEKSKVITLGQPPPPSPDADCLFLV